MQKKGNQVYLKSFVPKALLFNSEFIKDVGEIGWTKVMVVMCTQLYLDIDSFLTEWTSNKT